MGARILIVREETSLKNETQSLLVHMSCIVDLRATLLIESMARTCRYCRVTLNAFALAIGSASGLCMSKFRILFIHGTIISSYGDQLEWRLARSVQSI